MMCPKAMTDATTELGKPGSEGILLRRWKIGMTDKNNLVFMHAAENQDLRIAAGVVSPQLFLTCAATTSTPPPEPQVLTQSPWLLDPPPQYPSPRPSGINTKSNKLWSKYIHGYGAIEASRGLHIPAEVKYTRAHMDLNYRYTTLGTVGEASR